MGLLDKVKDMMGKGTDSVNLDKVKDTAGRVKDKADDLVDQHGDKLPEGARKSYEKASDAAEETIPGADAAAAPSADAPSADAAGADAPSADAPSADAPGNNA